MKSTLLLILILITGCSALAPKPPIKTAYYSLGNIQAKAESNNSLNANKALPTLIVNTPKAAAGFDTRHMMYTRSPHQLEYFARNEWIDTPAYMLQPLIVEAIEQTQAFNAVLPKLTAVRTDLRLESEVIKLVQDFNTKPSQILLSLRVTVIDNATNKIMELHQFDEAVITTTDDPIGGVKAANLAVNQALEKLRVLSKKLSADWVNAQKIVQQ